MVSGLQGVDMWWVVLLENEKNDLNLIRMRIRVKPVIYIESSIGGGDTVNAMFTDCQLLLLLLSQDRE